MWIGDYNAIGWMHGCLCCGPKPVEWFPAGLRQQLADANDLASSSAAGPMMGGSPLPGTSSFLLLLSSLVVIVLSCLVCTVDTSLIGAQLQLPNAAACHHASAIGNHGCVYQPSYFTVQQLATMAVCANDTSPYMLVWQQHDLGSL